MKQTIIIAAIILLGFGLISPCFAGHDFRGAYRHPNIPAPKEISVPEPQTHTFPALDTNNTFTGINNFGVYNTTGAGTHSGTETFANINKRIFTSQQAGADVCARINAALTTASAGWIVDANDDVLTSTCASNVTLSKAVTLILPPVTLTSNTDPAISITSSNANITCAIPQQCFVVQGTVNQNAINIAAGLSNVTLDGISATATANYATETLMEVNLIHGNPVYGAGTSGSPLTDIVIKDCQFNNGNNSILLSYTNRSRITGNKFDTPAQANPGLSQVFFNGLSTFNTISHNTFNDTIGIANAVYIRMSGVPNESPSNNTVGTNTINGIYQFEGINIAGSYNSVTNNAIKNASNVTNAAGIALFEPAAGSQADTVSICHHNTVAGNAVQMLGANHNEAIVAVDNGSTGDLGCNDNVISANTVSAVSGHGIGVGVNNLGGSHIGGYRNTVIGNKVDVQQNSKDAINLFNSNDTLVSGNHIQSTAGTPGNGVNLANSLRSIVTSNDMVNWNAGVFTNGSLTYNAVVSGNYFRSVGNAIAPNAASPGITVWGNYYDPNVTTKFQLNSNTLTGIFDPLILAEQPVTGFTTATGQDFCYADSTLHTIACSLNNGSFQNHPQTVVLHSAYTNATTTFSTLGDGTRTVSFPVLANRDFTLTCDIAYQSSATTAGPKIQLTGPASPTAVLLTAQGGTNATAYADAAVTAFSTALTAFGTAGATATNFILRITAGISNGANAGTIALQLAANGAGTLTVAAGSSCRIQ